ncbi:Hint domain-containing protein [Tabrizicola sp. J26]|uniref:Hint domain-containing protein n=1 Tax=Alitabrizicola rongguiensis TaxID=2909234 RepID=UPI001F2C6011|nr:Hint domain-containing protein [Tabrizicola rongguiensis]MCF1707732.1 Hint domain-containing protein [Tabrizicola rongguiensis]
MFMQDLTRLIARATPMPVARALPRCGLVSGTLIETAQGWVRVEELRRGDLVHSFDGGLREVVALDRDWLAPGKVELVHLAGGVMGNCADVALMPGQALLIDCWDEPDVDGAVVALVPAAAMIGLSGTSLAQTRGATEVVIPVFAEEEVVHAQGGLLLHCPGVGSRTRHSEAGFFTRLSRERAHQLLCKRLQQSPSLVWA